MSLKMFELDHGIHGCTACSLHKTTRRKVPGEYGLDAKILVVGEAPGAEEETQGRPFVGPSGQLLRQWLTDAGYKPGEYIIVNAIKCRPPFNRTPTGLEISLCKFWLDKQLAIFNCKKILVCGKVAYQAVMEYEPESFLKQCNTVKMTKLGKIIIFPHPAYVLRNPEFKVNLKLLV